MHGSSLQRLAMGSKRFAAAKLVGARRLTVKLRGRPQTPNWSRGCTISSSARGDTTDVHGPLQRLLASGRKFFAHDASH